MIATNESPINRRRDEMRQSAVTIADPSGKAPNPIRPTVTPIGRVNEMPVAAAAWIGSEMNRRLMRVKITVAMTSGILLSTGARRDNRFIIHFLLNDGQD